MSDEMSSYERAAQNLGKSYGTNAAEWAIEPDRMSRQQMADLLKGIDDGDPLVMDQFREPNLSGENQGEPTPQNLAEDLGLGDGQEDELDKACEAWEEAASTSFWAKIETTLNYHLG